MSDNFILQIFFYCLYKIELSVSTLNVFFKDFENRLTIKKRSVQKPFEYEVSVDMLGEQ